MRTPRSRDLPVYVTDRAVMEARALGLNLSSVDWRSIFLAITDNLTNQSTAPQDVSAQYIGATRMHERWAITCRGNKFDVLYQPELAVIEGVTGSRPSNGAPAILPKPRNTGGGSVAKKETSATKVAEEVW